MSINEVHQALRQFERDLERFNDSIKSGVAALEREHDSISGIWHDDFRKQYDTRWKAFGDNVKKYSSRDAGKYVAFVKTKIQRVEQYLNG